MVHYLLKQSQQYLDGITAGISLALMLYIMVQTGDRAQAQVVEDQTLPDNTTVNLSRDTLIIEGGTQVGNNLFHSFLEFSLPDKQTAYFNNQPHIVNIFSRVTGKNPSYINGVIQANPGANLFIINPNGISFGSNASLQISGSFVASTAKSIHFAGGEIFSAEPTASTPLLIVKTPLGLQVGNQSQLTSESVYTPIGLQFGSIPGNIQVQGESSFNPVTLHTQADQTLALVGGDLLLENAQIHPFKSIGRLELGSVNANGFVGLSLTKSGIVLNYDAAPQLGNLQLLTGTNIYDFTDIQINGRNILFKNAFIQGENELTINNSNDLQILDNSNIYVNSPKNVPGNLTINTKNLLIQDASTIGIDKGNLIINAADTLQINSDLSVPDQRLSRIFATTAEDTTKTAGNLLINTRHLLVQNGSQIITNSLGAALPPVINSFDVPEVVSRGNLTVNASESVTLSGSSLAQTHPSGLFTRTFSGENSGWITINTKVLSITDGAQVFTSNFSNTKTANLTVNATEKIEILGTSQNGKIWQKIQSNAVIDDPNPDSSLISLTSILGLTIQNTLPSALFTNAPSFTDAGDINISTRELVTQAGGQISTNVFSSGRGGDLTVDATTQIQLLGTSANGISSGLFTRANPTAKGDAGTLNIVTGNLLVRDGAQVSASTFGAGKGGDLNIQARRGIKLIGVSHQNVPSGLFTQSNIRNPENLDKSTSPGDAGELTINTSTLLVRDGAQVGASTLAGGQAGNLTVLATERIELIGTSGTGDIFPSGLFTLAVGASGDAGNLFVETPQLLVRNGAQIGVSTRGQGEAGNLTVNVKDRVQLIGTAINGVFPSGLFATGTSTSTGDAGNLTLNTDLLQVWQGAGIAVRNRGEGVAGNLLVNARTIDLNDLAFMSADTRGVSANLHQPQANINLRSQELLLLRGNSSITTNAIGKNVIGGNINIDTKLLAAFENSDISANSVNFRGGQVKITAEGITGTQFRQALTPDSDITATGVTPELSGTVEISTPQLDPTQGLTELPVNMIDVSNRIVQKCRPNTTVAKQPNQFLVTGKGGIAISPYETLRNESAIANWIDVNHIHHTHQHGTHSTKITNTPEKAIVEAQAWVYDHNGNIVLTATPPNFTPTNSTMIHPVCAGVDNSKT